MLVRELLTSDATSVREDTDLDTAVHLLADLRVSALPVVDAEDHVVGFSARLTSCATWRSTLVRTCANPGRWTPRLDPERSGR